MEAFKNCRGDEKKRELVAKYKIQPVSYVKILNGQTMEGCCGPLEDRYYVFYAVDRNLSDNGLYFKVGLHCAEKFLELTNERPLELFNPLVAEVGNVQNGGGVNHQVNRIPQNNVAYEPINRELVNAINLILIAWNDFPREGMLKSILDFTKKFPDRKNLNGVKWFNGVILSDKQHRNFDQIMDSLREKNNLRNFTFRLMHEYLVGEDIKSNIYAQ